MANACLYDTWKQNNIFYNTPLNSKEYAEKRRKYPEEYLSDLEKRQKMDISTGFHWKEGCYKINDNAISKLNHNICIMNDFEKFDEKNI